MVELGKFVSQRSIGQRRQQVDRRMGAQRCQRPQLVQQIMGHGVGRSPWRGSKPKARRRRPSTHAGTPLGSPLLPLWSDETTWEPLAIWRSEGAVTWKRGRMRAGVHMLALADQWWLEAWGAWTLHSEWPLHLTAGFETWQLEGSPNMPSEGLRWRVGVSHTLVMSPGRPTFARPCCP